jgi:hypothetical protein
MRIKTREDRRQRIKLRLRKRIAGNEQRPRLTVFRSLAHIYVQVIDDMTGKTVASAATTEPALKSGLSGKTRGGNKGGCGVHRPDHRAASEGQGHHQGGVRPQRLPVSRSDSGGGRRRRAKQAWSSDALLADSQIRRLVD